MKSIRNLLAAAVLGGGSLLAAAAGYSGVSAADDAAAPAAMHGAGAHGWGPGRLYRRLDLTPDQQASLKTIMTAAKPGMQSLHAQMRANHLKLMQTPPDDPNYATVVAEVAQADASLASQRTTQGAALTAQMYALLTPPQKTQLAALQAEWAARPHPDHRGHPGGPAPAPAPAT